MYVYIRIYMAWRGMVELLPVRCATYHTLSTSLPTGIIEVLHMPCVYVQQMWSGEGREVDVHMCLTVMPLTMGI